MPRKKTILRSARVLTSTGLRPASIQLEREQIVAILPHGEAPEGATVIEYGDRLILPGAVDLHVHLNEPGRTAWEGFSTGTAAAAAGGITTLVDMPLNSCPVTTTVAALQLKREAAKGKLHTDVAFHGGIVRGSAGDALELLDEGVAGMKAFLIDSGLDDFQASKVEDLLAVMPRLATLGIPLLVHAELPEPAAPLMCNARSHADWAASRPATMELAAVDLLIGLVRQTGCAVHIVHVAASEVLPLIEAAKREGLPITAETCPHYLEFCDEEIPEGRTEFKCAPPIRSRANREALWQAVANGVIDTIGSDHSPCDPELKCIDTGDFAKAWGGISSLEIMVPGFISGALRRGVSIERISDALSAAPARVIGLEDRLGTIAPGRLANLIVIDDQRPTTVEPQALLQRHKVTPWAGRQLDCSVIATWLRGTLVAEGGNVTEPTGRAIDLREHPGVLVLNRAPSQAAESMLAKCCGATRWWQLMSDARPFKSRAHLLATAETIAERLTESDWLEAFSHHPKIGDVDSLRRKFAATAAWSATEQGAVTSADEETIQGLARGNDEYEKRFGFIFIVCASGKSAPEMLAILQARLLNDRATEIRNAAREQRRITRLRLDKMLA